MIARDKIIRAFYESKKRELYFNELVRLTLLSHSMLQRTLSKLIDEGLLATKKTTAHRIYYLNNSGMLAIEFSKIAKNTFAHLHRNIRVPLEQLLKEIPRSVYTIVLFGSASRGTQKDGSDIDILLVYNEQKQLGELKQRFDAISKYPLSIFEYSVEGFLKNQDHVVIQAKKTGFPIYGEQFFFEVQLDEYSRIR